MRPDYFLDVEEETAEIGEGNARPSDTERSASEPARADQSERSAEPVVTVERRRSGGWRWVVLTIGVMLGCIAYLRYGTPYVTDATDQVYILSIQREGLIFKTFEGEMVSRSALEGTDRIYSRGSSFSVEDEAVGEALQQAKLAGRPVTVEYKRYYGSLPWRGNSTTFITAIKIPPQK